MNELIKSGDDNATIVCQIKCRQTRLQMTQWSNVSSNYMKLNENMDWICPNSYSGLSDSVCLQAYLELSFGI